MSKESMIIGRNSVTEALRAGRSISKIYLAAGNQAPALERIRELAGERGILIENVPPKVLHRLAPDERHQGVVAMAAAIDFADLTDVLADVEAKEEVPFLVLLDGIEDVHNLGAIIRTAECAGVHAVLVPKRRSAPLNETVGKTSAGAIEYMPIVPVGNSTQLLKKLKKRGFWIIGADMDGTVDYFHSSLTEPIVLVIGSEGRGMSRLVKETCDVLVQIPMFGHVNSLNASVAAALLIYEAVRQRQVVTQP
ncbi:23S rRNA (guanosine(2251)-2'-O)-methyltransferase RlmB [Megasphaera sp. DJF_B143]|uniref:23S rRNA (guanosine(2251)-2'-O)-methyltransferase RlmB n=1 Tax=Megasphaera sp. DJF_B143 TaxID=537288 RepID=UPI00073F67F8|nr:23S rRNA (guanosine(2251)-2'-O)-methyltransferase RlmB [Megasphaera sp. DJF_B143]KUH57452.1 RNA methyltransferase [Megasphaera sp. DJF_B143]